MQATTVFDVGDRVYSLQRNDNSPRVTCPVCLGRARVKLVRFDDGVEVGDDRCRECYGGGTVCGETEFGFRVVEWKIEKVEIVTTVKSGTKVRYKSSARPAGRWASRTEYTAQEGEVFASKEGAEREAERRVARLKAAAERKKKKEAASP